MTKYNLPDVGSVEWYKSPLNPAVVDLDKRVTNVEKIARTARLPTLCTSTTRPTSPVHGEIISETDTDRLYTWDGFSWLWLPRPGGSAFAMATGRVNVTLNAAASASFVVAFPTGRFAVSPVITCSAEGTSTYVASPGSISASQFTLTVFHKDSTATTVTLPASWIATQMTPTAASG